MNGEIRFFHHHIVMLALVETVKYHFEYFLTFGNVRAFINKIHTVIESVILLADVGKHRLSQMKF
jgi:hypothetical protein